MIIIWKYITGSFLLQLCVYFYQDGVIGIYYYRLWIIISIHNHGFVIVHPGYILHTKRNLEQISIYEHSGMGSACLSKGKNSNIQKWNTKQKQIWKHKAKSPSLKHYLIMKIRIK